eukprot:CAMPEP_0201132750 /NCGR_PEP_ID=MMETSP0850-20130426/46728_1 /ASSEMBLY_ACC=CAM_ASM_000622 /TAXON_ID=183588 /ORGANISM="Pseudo-nitzschia fraudulenta, Strain WWA7" /LENGTH=197 /DNA_ID=CAMNT_0047403175 /DNA_START=925 /DNA_END=1515 /DNA_ORIENTATION=-
MKKSSYEPLERAPVSVPSSIFLKKAKPVHLLPRLVSSRHVTSRLVLSPLVTSRHVTSQTSHAGLVGQEYRGVDGKGPQQTRTETAEVPPPSLLAVDGSEVIDHSPFLRFSGVAGGRRRQDDLGHHFVGYQVQWEMAQPGGHPRKPTPQNDRQDFGLSIVDVVVVVVLRRSAALFPLVADPAHGLVVGREPESITDGG